MKEINEYRRPNEAYEKQFSPQLIPLLPAFARMDGVNFHSFTKDLARPFDENFIQLMRETTKFLAEETNACLAYTQSDEITLCWQAPSFDSQIYHNGKVQKMASKLASLATIFFNKNLPKFLPSKVNSSPIFDARVWNVPNQTEALNVFIWREQDATRNSINMLGRAYFSHKEMNNKSTNEVQEMLFQEHAINWNNYPSYCKRGSYIKKEKELRAFTSEELNLLPEKHLARTNPGMLVERHRYVFLENLPETIF